MEHLNEKQLVELVLASFEAERTQNIEANKALLHPDFTMTDMIIAPDGSYLPRIGGRMMHRLMKEAFAIEERDYIFKTVLADEPSQTVVVEFIESFPDPTTKQLYRTPQVAICQVESGKIRRTRHYMDPRLSFENLSVDEIDKVFE